MSKLLKVLNRWAAPLDPSVDWIELVRDLQDPIPTCAPKIDFAARWAEKKDVLAIDAMQYFVKEVEMMQKDLELGDRCLLLERSEKICAFAWVTFRDCRMGLWHILHLPAGSAYLVFIHVQPEYRQQGVGTHLMNLLMQALRGFGQRILISGTFAGWDIPLRLHLKTGFKITRKYTERKLLRFFPYPPQVTEIER